MKFISRVAGLLKKEIIILLLNKRRSINPGEIQKMARNQDGIVFSKWTQKYRMYKEVQKKIEESLDFEISNKRKYNVYSHEWSCQLTTSAEL